MENKHLIINFRLPNTDGGKKVLEMFDDLALQLHTTRAKLMRKLVCDALGIKDMSFLKTYKKQVTDPFLMTTDYGDSDV